MNAELKRIRTAAETQILQRFADCEESLPGNAAAHADRRNRMALFENEGLPHRRIEPWKYTDLRTLVREIAPLAQTSAPHGFACPAPMIDGAHQILVVDGHLVAGQGGLPDGVTLKPLMQALADGEASLAGTATPERAIDALNAAFVRDGYVLAIAADTKVDAPLELVFLRTGAATLAHARAHIHLASGAQATIIERHAGPDGVAMQSSTVTQYHVAREAVLAALRVQAEGDAATHLGETRLELHQGAQARLLHLASGARLARAETRAVFAGEHARLDVAGITMAAGRQHSDLTLYVDHNVPHCQSTESFRTVIDDSARAVFQGKIVVARDAQKVDAQMAINALLLSETADMVAKPELEIFADDVTCAHGATCGDIDEDLMFYLLARGIPPREARKLLLQAFLSEGAALYDGHLFQQLAFDSVETWLAAHAAR